MSDIRGITDSPFVYHIYEEAHLDELHRRVLLMRSTGKLSPQVLRRIQQFFRIKGIYHSNAIEGNSLTIGETRLVVETGLTLSGKTLRDQAEAKNLSQALNFMEHLAADSSRPITLSDIRQMHHLILKDIDDAHAGRYRTTEVHIVGSRYVPVEPQYVDAQMHDLGNWIHGVTGAQEPIGHPLVLAAVAHAWLVKIHPFVDGNGRTARLLMNLILTRFGYPICIISHDDRLRYYDALEESQSSDLTALIQLMVENTAESLEEWEQAADDQRREQEWLADITARFAQPALSRTQNEYELWTNAMDLLRTYFRQTVDAWNERVPGGARVTFKDFGMLNFEKYLLLRNGESAKRTWFFRIDFMSGNLTIRYLFFFGYGDTAIRSSAPVVLIVAKETAPFFYEPLENLPAITVPDLRQIGFDIPGETFIASTHAGVMHGKIEALGRQFLEQVVERDFSS
jgi:Fic family protein